jgi:hypothetical protein
LIEIYQIKGLKGYKEMCMNLGILTEIISNKPFYTGELDMSEVLIDMATTILSVLIGGIIAIVTNNLVNTRMLKKQHVLDLLREVKKLLSDWSSDVSEYGILFLECSSVEQYNGYFLSPSLRSLINIFEINPSVLKNFKDEFTRIRNKELKVQLLASENKKVLHELSEKHGTKDTSKLIEYKDVNDVLEKYAAMNMEIHEEIWSLIARIDKFIFEDIL